MVKMLGSAYLSNPAFWAQSMVLILFAYLSDQMLLSYRLIQGVMVWLPPNQKQIEALPLPSADTSSDKQSKDSTASSKKKPRKKMAKGRVSNIGHVQGRTITGHEGPVFKDLAHYVVYDSMVIFAAAMVLSYIFIQTGTCVYTAWNDQHVFVITSIVGLVVTWIKLFEQILRTGLLEADVLMCSAAGIIGGMTSFALLVMAPDVLDFQMEGVYADFAQHMALFFAKVRIEFAITSVWYKAFLSVLAAQISFFSLFATQRITRSLYNVIEVRNVNDTMPVSQGIKWLLRFNLILPLIVAVTFVPSLSREIIFPSIAEDVARRDVELAMQFRNRVEWFECARLYLIAFGIFLRLYLMRPLVKSFLDRSLKVLSSFSSDNIDRVQGMQIQRVFEATIVYLPKFLIQHMGPALSMLLLLLAYTHTTPNVSWGLCGLVSDPRTIAEGARVQAEHASAVRNATEAALQSLSSAASGSAAKVASVTDIAAWWRTVSLLSSPLTGVTFGYLLFFSHAVWFLQSLMFLLYHRTVVKSHEKDE